MFSHLPFDCVLLGLLLLTRSLEGSGTAEVGQNAYLPCNYSPSTSEDLVPVCWGRGPCPVFQCQGEVLRTDGRHVTYRTSSRYQLKGYLQNGDVSLTIENVTLADSGTYCCRIQFTGPMNDKKLDLQLDIKPVAETQTLETLHDKNQTQISTSTNELQDSGATTRISVYIGAGISAGLALVLIFGALILKWHFHRKQKLQNSRQTAQKMRNLSATFTTGSPSTVTDT